MNFTDIGIGRVIYSQGEPYYTGTLPFENKRSVVVVPANAVYAIINGGVEALKLTRRPMPEPFYDNDTALFLDEIVHNAEDGTIHKLFLDRHLYGRNPKDEIWLRYASVDQMSIDERGNFEEEDTR